MSEPRPQPSRRYDGSRLRLIRAAEIGTEVALDLDGRRRDYVPAPRAARPASDTGFVELSLDGRRLDAGSSEAAYESHAAIEMQRMTAERLAGDAADLVERTRRQADAILQQAAEQATVIQHDAYREGRDQGYADGQAAARAELVEALALVQRVAAEAKSVRDRVLMHAEREIVELVIGATRTVLGEQVRLDSSLVLDTVERALSRAGSLNVVRIRVNPADHEVVATGLISRIGDTAAAWSVTADGAISVGGCIIDTAAGEIDARLDAQLGEVARALREALPDAVTHEAGLDSAASLFDDANAEGWRHVA